MARPAHQGGDVGAFRVTRKARHWQDLTPDQKKRRMAWTRGAGVPNERRAPAPAVDPEVRRLAAAIRERVRARRVAEGRV